MPTNGRQHWQSHAPSYSQHARGVSTALEFKAGWGSSSSQEDCPQPFANEPLGFAAFAAPTTRHESPSAIVVATIRRITSGRTFTVQPPSTLDNSAIVERALLQSESFVPNSCAVATRGCVRALIVARRRAFSHFPSYYPRHDDTDSRQYPRHQVDGGDRRAM